MKLPESELFEQLRGLNFPLEDFAIFGSGPMWLRGMREPNDLDLVVRPRLHAELMGRKDKITVEKFGRPVLQYAGGSIEALNFWVPGEWDMDDLIDTAEIVDGFRFVTLDNVIKWKEERREAKDLRDLELIRKYLSQAN